ncbi:MAG: Stk1 family PASTA domain-containing Ser/Thr kinase, partial [Clostridiaceae bacterium]
MIGKILGKRYQIVEKIATGGMSTVYKALDLNLKRYDAIKILKEEFSQNPDFVEKFRQEANSVAGLNHPNIVNIYNVGSEGNLQYIVMEYVKGKNLKSVIRSKGRLFQDQVINYSIQIAKALEQAHSQGIIHRDIKPHNIMITEDDRIKVTDFGIAKHSESSTITNSGRIIGSVHYFSPEQARGLTTDKRTDIYSLGIVMYEMITGRLPFDSESPVTVALKHMQEPIIPPKTINPQVSDKLNAVIMKATQKDPIDRYQSIEDMLSDIERIKGSEDLLFAVPTSSIGDMENTQVMAPIKGQDIKYARKTVRRPIDNFEYDEDDYIEEEKQEKKKNRGLLLLLLGLLVALTVTSLLGYNYLMNQAEKKRIAEEQAKIIQVPVIKGMTQDRAKLELATNELSMKVVGTENSDGPGGVVLNVSPEEGTEVKKGDTINVIVSALKESVIVPEFTDKTLDEYKELLASAGLT